MARAMVNACAEARRQLRQHLFLEEGLPMPFAPIPDVLAEIRKGRMIILCDDEDRENEGDL